jgi:L-rhamnose mutarotase
MKRVGFKMKLFPGKGEEYKRRHDEIWPELKTLLKEAGIRDYVIFFDEETGILFGNLKLKIFNSYDQLPGNPVMKKWWDYMKDMMDTNPDNSPVSSSLKEMFYLE